MSLRRCGWPHRANHLTLPERQSGSVSQRRSALIGMEPVMGTGVVMGATPRSHAGGPGRPGHKRPSNPIPSNQLTSYAEPRKMGLNDEDPSTARHLRGGGVLA